MTMMADDPNDLVVEHLRHIRGRVDATAADMHEMQADMHDLKEACPRSRPASARSRRRSPRGASALTGSTPGSSAWRRAATCSRRRDRLLKDEHLAPVEQISHSYHIGRIDTIRATHTIRMESTAFAPLRRGHRDIGDFPRGWQKQATPGGGPPFLIRQGSMGPPPVHPNRQTERRPATCFRNPVS